jgi:aspartyl-tRNA(Asn)/glutamyl-tRNA(Gln) amidotransferase subunit A
VSNIFSHIGPLTWTVRDAAILLQVMAGYDARDPHALRGDPPDFLTHLGDGVKEMRIAWSLDLGYAAVDPEVGEVCASAVRTFEELGAHVEAPALKLEHPFSFFFTVYHAFWYASYEEIYQKHADLLADYARVRLGDGQRVTIPQYFRAMRSLETVDQQIADVFEKYDLLLTPTVAVPAFPIGQRPSRIGGEEVHPIYGFYPFTAIFNATGHPAASIPCGFSRDGLPIGLQVVGRKGEEEMVLRASYAFEQAHPWQGKRP